MEAINYFVEVTHDELTALNRTKTKTADNTILVLPKINKYICVTLLVRMREGPFRVFFLDLQQ